MSARLRSVRTPCHLLQIKCYYFRVCGTPVGRTEFFRLAARPPAANSFLLGQENSSQRVSGQRPCYTVVLVGGRDAREKKRLSPCIRGHDWSKVIAGAGQAIARRATSVAQWEESPGSCGQGAR